MVLVDMPLDPVAVTFIISVPTDVCDVYCKSPIQFLPSYHHWPEDILGEDTKARETGDNLAIDTCELTVTDECSRTRCHGHH